MASDTPATSGRRYEGFALVLACLVLAVVLVRTAWVGEDALITMRTVDNFVHGRGLRWNPDDRVQTFTHPLWMFVLSAAYFFTREIFTTVTAVCILFSIGAFVVLLRGRSLPVTLFVLVAFCSSRALVNFATSGFENPLTNLLLALFAVAFVEHDRERVPWLRLSFLAALCATNRLDTLVIFFPAFVWLVARSWPRVAWKRIAIGALPLALWVAFSVFYFGFAVPNPAPAKVTSFMPLGFYLYYGVRDFAGLFYRDLASGVLVVIGIACAVGAIVRFARERRDSETARLAALGVGMLCYCVCVIRVGGDFIIGRYWISPMWLSLILAVYRVDRAWQWWLATGPVRKSIAALASIVFVFALHRGGAELGSRMFNVESPGILRSIAHAYLKPDFTWVITDSGLQFRGIGESARRLHEETGKRAFPVSVIGFAGIAAGPDVILVDILGLGDPLLARLPPMKQDYKTVGHMDRKLPVGYVEARETGSLDKMQPAMRAYYEKLRLVTSGPLLDLDRWKAIAELHLGRIEPPSEYD